VVAFKNSAAKIFIYTRAVPVGRLEPKPQTFFAALFFKKATACLA
jgi:hypothetical protein